MMSGFDAAAAGIDVNTPNVARIYDYALGGKDNYLADRAAMHRLLKFSPVHIEACRQSRAFLGRVVREAAAAGIRQFLDIGSGLPTQQNVHEIAQRASPGSRVVYVDYDPVVVAHTRALLAGTDNTWIIQQDVREPQEILNDPLVRRVLDWDEPVLILLVSVLHFVTDRERPDEIVRQLAAPAAPGSYVAIAHGTDEGIPPRDIIKAQELFDDASAPWVPRRTWEVARWLAEMQILAPGAVPVGAWRPASPQDAEGAERTGMFGVVAAITPGPQTADAG
jgi:O-methyltransferase involved in polyketide biosynthesis